MSEENIHTEAWGENGVKNTEISTRDIGDMEKRSNIYAIGGLLGQERNGTEKKFGKAMTNHISKLTKDITLTFMINSESKSG